MPTSSSNSLPTSWGPPDPAKGSRSDVDKKDDSSHAERALDQLRNVELLRTKKKNEVKKDDENSNGALVALRFNDPLMAHEALLAALRLQNSGVLALDDAVVVTKSTNGRIRLRQTRDVTLAQGAISGSWLGLAAGFLMTNPLAGVILGAVIGGVWAKFNDIGISDTEMRELSRALPPGEAALFLLVTGGHRVLAMNEARRFPAELFHHTLRPRDRDDLIAALGSNVTTY